MCEECGVDVSNSIGSQGTTKLWMIVWEYDKENLDAGNGPALYESQNINRPEIERNDETNEI